MSGVGQSNISAIENGRRAPSADTLNRLLVACGFELAATAGDTTIFCPLPRGGMVSDGEPAPSLAGDPPDERPTLPHDASMAARVQVVTAVLDAADATRSR